MLGATVTSFTSPWVITSKSSSSMSLVLFPITLFLGMYILSRLEKESLLYHFHLDHVEKLLSKIQLNGKIERLDDLQEEKSNGAEVFTGSNILLDNGHTYSKQNDALLDRDEFLVQNLLAFNQLENQTANKSDQQPRLLNVVNYFEIGLLAFIALGGAGFIFLERNKVVDYDNNLNAINLSIEGSVNQSILDSKAVRKSQPINIDKNKLDQFDHPDLKLNDNREVTAKSISSKKMLSGFNGGAFDNQNNKKNTLTLRRLMFDLTPSEYASLIPTPLEIEWYDRGVI